MKYQPPMIIYTTHITPIAHALYTPREYFAQKPKIINKMLLTGVSHGTKMINIIFYKAPIPTIKILRNTDTRPNHAPHI